MPAKRVDASSLGRLLAARRRHRMLICAICGKHFSAFGRQKYDRDACRKRAYRLKVKAADITALNPGRKGIRQAVAVGAKAVKAPALVSTPAKTKKTPTRRTKVAASPRLVWRSWVLDPANWRFTAEGVPYFVNPQTRRVQPGLQCPPTVLKALQNGARRPGA